MVKQSEQVGAAPLVNGSETALHSHAGGGGFQFPVGALYLSTTGVNPATELGYGTWSQVAQGQFLVGQNSGDADFDTAEETGGSKTHTHDAHYTVDNARTGGSLTVLTGPDTHSADGLPPYYVVYIWKRTG